MNSTGQPRSTENYSQPGAIAAMNGHRAWYAPDGQLHSFADSLPAMAWICGPDGRPTLFNKLWLRFTGYSLEQALSKGWDAIHPDDAHKLAAARAEALGAGAAETKYRLRRADGHYRWMLDQVCPRHDASGGLQGFIGLDIDITEGKQTREKLVWFSKVLEQSPASVVITDLNGNIEYVNPKFTEVTGYSYDEAIGRNPRILKSGEKSAEEYRELWETIQTGEWRGEFHNKRKNGELYWEAASICPIRDSSGRPTHYLAVKEEITDRKRLEDQLRASEERLRIATENAGLCIYEVDSRTGVGVNYGADPFLQSLRNNQDWMAAIHPDDVERLRVAHRRRLEPGWGLQEEYRLVYPDGGIRHFSDYGAPARAGRLIGVLRDITESKRAEESMAQLAAIVECSADAILALDTRGAITRWNAAAEKLYGYAAAEVTGHDVLLLPAPAVRERAVRNINTILGGRSFSAESLHRRKDGTLFPVSISTSPIRDGCGQVVGGAVIVRDITCQKRDEAALRESENRFRALVQNSTDLISLMDPSGAILYDSPGVFDLLGVSPEQRVGSPAMAWIHPDDLPAIRGLHQGLLTNPNAKVRAQFRMRHADGSWRWCDSWAINQLNEPGVVALVASFRDITELKTAEAALRESEERYRQLVEEASDGIFTMDLEGRCTSLNHACVRISGYSREEALGMTLAQIIPPDRLPDLEQAVLATLSGKSDGRVETEILASDGRRVAVEVSGRPQVRNGVPVGLLCIARDIGERKRRERMDRDRREVLEMVAQNHPLNTVLHRIAETIERYFPGTRAGVTLADSPGSTARDADNTDSQLCCRLSVPIRDHDSRLLGMLEIDSAEPWNPSDSEHIVLDSKAKLAAIALEHRQITNRLAYQAQHDPLTGLPNRALLEDRLRQAIALARRQSNMVAVIYADLDRFKYINDTLGHDTGDLLLQEAARRLRNAVRESDTLARPGGDEFVAVLPGIDSPRYAELVGERIIEAMRQPFQVQGHELFISASVGSSIYPQDGEDPATLQKHADIAMYEAKSGGRNRFQTFYADLDSASHERLEIENHLHRAMERSELQLYYQPQFQLLSGELCGVEALLRWNHPKWGLVPPNRFIPVAEDCGLIIPISLWVLREACRQHSAWRSAGQPPVRIAVNISATQFTRSNLAEQVADALREHAVEPRFLEVELTEGVLMRDLEDSARQIAALRDLGVRIAIDDFGTGYSSLGYLRRLPIDDLKIDKCFVQGIANGGTEPLVNAIVGLAHGLNMTATAEGVESEEEMKVLRELGCDRVQGYLLGRPVPANELDQWPAKL